MKPCIVRWLCGAFALIVAAGTLAAQPAPWEFSSDTTRTTVVGGRRAGPGDISQAYSYVMVYDSLCTVDYLVTECRRNGRLLALQNWHDGRAIHAPEQSLTFNSRTAIFPVAAGDTISFYRELKWQHPTTRFQGTTNYYSLDTLEWVAHLVRASDGAPVALLDSTGILPNTSPGTPRIYGSRPIMAIVRYIVPAAITGDSAFIGFTVHARGSGAYHFVRTEHQTFRVSNRLAQARYVDYLNHYSPPGLNRQIADNLPQSDDARFALAVMLDGTGRDATITFTVPNAEPASVSIGIYDAAGRLVYAPYNAVSVAGATTTRYHIPQAGAYIITLLYNGRVVRTRKLTIP